VTNASGLGIIVVEVRSVNKQAPGALYRFVTLSWLGLPMRRLISIVLITAFLSGCASVADRKRSVYFQKTTRHYENNIRWGEFEAAVSFINPDEVTAPEPDPALLKRIRVTSYEVLSTTISDDHNVARVTVEIRYYDEDRMSEITLTDRQTWKYDEEEEYWYLASPLPAFK